MIEEVCLTSQLICNNVVYILIRRELNMSKYLIPFLCCPSTMVREISKSIGKKPTDEGCVFLFSPLNWPKFWTQLSSEIVKRVPKEM